MVIAVNCPVLALPNLQLNSYHELISMELKFMYNMQTCVLTFLGLVLIHLQKSIHFYEHYDVLAIQLHHICSDNDINI